MMLMILECHRVALVSYRSTICEKIVSLHQTTKSLMVNDITLLREEYITLQYHCRSTAHRRGRALCMLFGFALLFIAYVIWSVYSHEFHIVAMIAHVLSSLVVVHELGWMLSTVNETGYLISRDLAALMLFTQTSDVATKHDVTIMLQCCQTSVLVVPFFGNAVLRPKSLYALVGSALGAIIPGLVVY